MITQTYKQGTHEIKIKIAESIDDAKKNNFENGVYAKYYIDNKRIANYYAMIKFISDEAKKTYQPIIQDEKKLLQIRNEMLNNQNTGEKVTTVHDTFIKDIKEIMKEQVTIAQETNAGITEIVKAARKQMYNSVDWKVRRIVNTEVLS